MAVGAVTARGLPLTNCIVGRSQLVAGSAAVALPVITDNSLILLTANDASSDGALQTVTVAGTGFTITSQTGADSGFIAWVVVIIP